MVAFVFLKFFPFAYLPKYAILTFSQLFEFIAYVNVMLGVFNMLPIPPLDGSHILSVLLMDTFPNFIRWLYSYSLFILIFLFVFIPHTRILLIYMIMGMHGFLRGLVF